MQQGAVISQLIGVIVKSADPTAAEFGEKYPDSDVGFDEVGNSS